MFLGITESPKCLLLNQTNLRLTRRVSLVEKELLTLPEHLSSSPPVFGGVRVTRSLVLYVCLVDRCLSFCTFSFGHCVVCSSSIYEFWLPLWYFQTLLIFILILNFRIWDLWYNFVSFLDGVDVISMKVQWRSN